MTEREKVLPFEFAGIDGGGEQAEGEDLEEAGMGDELKSSATTLGPDGKPIAEWDALNTFFTRHNKILLDKTAMDIEGKRLNQENERLRQLIKQFVDGTSLFDLHLTSIYLHLPLFAPTCLHLPPFTSIYLHLPPFAPI